MERILSCQEGSSTSKTVPCLEPGTVTALLLHIFSPMRTYTFIEYIFSLHTLFVFKHASLMLYPIYLIFKKTLRLPLCIYMCFILNSLISSGRNNFQTSYLVNYKMLTFIIFLFPSGCYYYFVVLPFLSITYFVILMGKHSVLENAQVIWGKVFISPKHCSKS